jgi:hypothetical protein
MGLYVCLKCNCVENTALGLYWSRQRPDIFIWDESNEKYKGKPLCSECAPKLYSDWNMNNKQTGYGAWHGKFLKKNYNELSEEEKQGIYPAVK